MASDVSIFVCVCGPFVCPRRTVCSGPLPLFNWIVYLECSCVSSLYILEIQPLSEVSLANVFSHTVGSPFILLMLSLVVQQLFSLM